MKFERPPNILNLPKGINHKAFNDIYTKEYKERMRFLDVSLSLERSIDEFIGSFIIKDFSKYIEFEYFVLEKINFDQKITIIESILKKKEIFEKDLPIKKINGKEFKI
jgi:hypothetical protein